MEGKSVSNCICCDIPPGKLELGDLPWGSKNTLYAPGADDLNVNEAFCPAGMEWGFADVGESTDNASGEKYNWTGLPSLVKKVMVSPLTTRTEAVAGMYTPPSLLKTSLTSVFAIDRN
jgi:hypothetical protein